MNILSQLWTVPNWSTSTQLFTFANLGIKPFNIVHFKRVSA